MEVRSVNFLSCNLFSRQAGKSEWPWGHFIFCMAFGVGGGNNDKRASRIHAQQPGPVPGKRMSRQRETQCELWW
jgi:hypothetical protein